MTNTIKIKRGQKNNLSIAGVVDGELKYTKDTKELFIGTGSENIKIGGNPEDFPISKAVQTELNTYLTKNNASGTYVSKTEASNTYLQKTDASTTYLPIADAEEIYLSQADATSTFLSQVNAGLTYVTKEEFNTALAGLEEILSEV